MRLGWRHGPAKEHPGNPATGPLQVPLEIAVRETSDAGVPIVIAHPDSASAAVYRSIAERVAQKLAAGAGAQAPPKIVME